VEVVLPTNDRPIQNVSDVEALLDAGDGSTREYLRGCRVARREGRPDLRYQCAAEALDTAISSQSHLAGEAVDAVICSYVARAESVSDLQDSIDSAMGWIDHANVELESLRGRPKRDSNKTLEDRKQELEDMSEYLERGGYRALASLASLLRRPFNCSDTALAVAEHAIEVTQDPVDSRAFVCRAAALADLDRLDEAWEAIRVVMEEDPNNPFAMTCASRILRRMGRFDEALKIGKASFQTQSDDASAHTWVAAAAASGNLESARLAAEYLNGDDNEMDEQYLEALGIRVEFFDALESDLLDSNETVETINGLLTRATNLLKVRGLNPNSRRELRNLRKQIHMYLKHDQRPLGF